MPPLTIALVTDTHVRAGSDDGQQAFGSDAVHNDRNRTVVAAMEARRPHVVVHLGDVVHPIPTLPSHPAALAVAKSIYGALSAPLLVAPGNHDVGDKHTTANAPALVADGRKAFREHWGPPFRSLDVHGAHLVVLDGTLLDSDTEEAQQQRAWLEADLAGADDPIFVFTHYPPFLCEPDEPEHYDNLGLDARQWFLDQMVRHGVQAVFTGHAHRFFYNRYLGVDLYTLPSAAFVRPEYAALRPVPPSDAEHGRDDVEHLGFGLLTVDASGHRLELVRPFSASPQAGPPRALGIWVHRHLGHPVEVPYGDLDVLTRKFARNDAVLWQVLDLGLSRIRIPLADVADEAVAARVAWLARYGVASSVFSAGLPTPTQRATHQAHAATAAWEVVVRPSELARLGDLLRHWTGPALTVSRVGRPLQPPSARYHSHFPRIGFAPDDPALDALVAAARPGTIARVAFRIVGEASVASQVQAACERAAALGVAATCHVELPFGTEATAQTDDGRVTTRVQDAVAASQKWPEAWLFLDRLADKDRGYWCRHGLVSPADQPRAAYAALKESPLG